MDSSRIAHLNPNTGTVPLFRTRRDAALITAIYECLPVLVDRSSGEEVKAWPVKYATMFHMTNDSSLFRTRAELEEREGPWPIGGNRFASPSGEWRPLYEGKMVQIYNHRYANVRINPRSISGQGVTDKLNLEELRDPTSLPQPRFWVNADQVRDVDSGNQRIGINDVCNTNNARSLLACLAPSVGFGNTLPVPSLEGNSHNCNIALLCANFCALICDYVARQKIQSRHLNKYILEQLPVVPPDRCESVRFGPKTASEIVRECPSSKQMGLLSVFHREDLAHLCLMLSRLALMVQAAVLGGQFFDLFSLFDDGGVASKVGVGWSYVADALVVALVVVVIDEGADLVFEIAG